MPTDLDTKFDRLRVLREAAAAAYCGLSVVTFRRLRKAGTGPRAVRLGERSHGYQLAALHAWLDARATPPAGGDA